MLDVFLRDNCKNLEEQLVVFHKLCEVVGALHVKGLIHRDLKPANILVDAHGSIRLLDFGLAQVARDISEISLAPSVMGTLDYMAPEQAAPNMAPDSNDKPS